MITFVSNDAGPYRENHPLTRQSEKQAVTQCEPACVQASSMGASPTNIWITFKCQRSLHLDPFALSLGLGPPYYVGGVTPAEWPYNQLLGCGLKAVQQDF